MQIDTFIPTNASLEAFALLDQVRETPSEVGALFGAPGTGKTTALRQFSLMEGATPDRPGRVLYVPCPPAAGPVQFLQLLQDRLRPEARPVLSVQDGLRRVHRFMARQGTELLVLDDANRLYKPVLEVLDTLVARTRVSVVLCGPERELRRRLARVAALEARVGRVRWFGLLTEAEVEDVVLEFSGLRLTGRQAVDTVEEIDLACGGNWARLLRLLDRCRDQAEAELTRRLSVPLVGRASGDLGLAGSEAA